MIRLKLTNKPSDNSNQPSNSSSASTDQHQNADSPSSIGQLPKASADSVPSTLSTLDGSAIDNKSIKSKSKPKTQRKNKRKRDNSEAADPNEPPRQKFAADLDSVIPGNHDNGSSSNKHGSSSSSVPKIKIKRSSSISNASANAGSLSTTNTIIPNSFEQIPENASSITNSNNNTSSSSTLPSLPKIKVKLSTKTTKQSSTSASTSKTSKAPKAPKAPKTPKVPKAPKAPKAAKTKKSNTKGVKAPKIKFVNPSASSSVIKTEEDDEYDYGDHDDYDPVAVNSNVAGAATSSSTLKDTQNTFESSGDLNDRPLSTESSNSSTKVVLKSKKDKLPKIRVKPVKQAGSGYDSEAPDREDDPMIEEAIVLRMIPGQHLDFLRAACEGEQGELKNVSIKFKDARRAVVTIHGQLFAAKLVDLPTITEAHKSFDRKNIYKVADVCQMLMVTEPIQYEDDVFKLESTASEGQDTMLIPHGITPPLYNVRRRRFRKRISRKVIESVEARVDELFRKDNEAIKTAYEVVDANAANGGSMSRAGSVGLTPRPEDDDDEDDEEEEEEEDEEEEEAEGEEGDGGNKKNALAKPSSKSSNSQPVRDEEEMDFSDLDVEFDKALKSVVDESNGSKPSSANNNAKVNEEEPDDDNDNDDDEGEDEDDDDEEEDDDDEDDEDDDDDDVATNANPDEDDDDEEGKEAVKRYMIICEEIRDLVHSLTQKEKEAEMRKNPILKNRVLNDIKKIKQEIELKKRHLKTIPGHENDNLEELMNKSSEDNDTENQQNEQGQENATNLSKKFITENRRMDSGSHGGHSMSRSLTTGFEASELLTSSVMPMSRTLSEGGSSLIHHGLDSLGATISNLGTNDSLGSISNFSNSSSRRPSAHTGVGVGNSNSVNSNNNNSSFAAVTLSLSSAAGTPVPDISPSSPAAFNITNSPRKPRQGSAATNNGYGDEDEASDEDDNGESGSAVGHNSRKNSQVYSRNSYDSHHDDHQSFVNELHKQLQQPLDNRDHTHNIAATLGLDILDAPGSSSNPVSRPSHPTTSSKGVGAGATTGNHNAQSHKTGKEGENGDDDDDENGDMFGEFESLFS